MSYTQQMSYYETLKMKCVDEAKLFCEANWYSVNDWTKLSITIRNGNPAYCPNKREYGSYSPPRPEREVEFGRKPNNSAYFNLMNDLRLGPVETVDDLFLDEAVDDLSITINNTEWWAIDDYAVTTLADYIKTELAFQNQ